MKVDIKKRRAYDRSRYWESHVGVIGIDRACEICKIVFPVAAPNQKFCKKCAKVNAKQKNTVWRIRNKKYLNEKCHNRRIKNGNLVICCGCGKEYLKLQYAKSKFCGRACAHKNMKKSRLGKKNPSYRNGFYVSGRKIRYPSDRRFDIMAKQIKNEMINEFGYLFCELCGVNNSLRWECHHIIYRSEAPNHINLHNKRNIILLCIRCHNGLHSCKSSRINLLKERKLWELFPELPKL